MLWVLNAQSITNVQVADEKISPFLYALNKVYAQILLKFQESQGNSRRSATALEVDQQPSCIVLEYQQIDRTANVFEMSKSKIFD